jgi:hypothetical protein
MPVSYWLTPHSARDLCEQLPMKKTATMWGGGNYFGVEFFTR